LINFRIRRRSIHVDEYLLFGEKEEKKKENC
jgi:hypothetical protein